MLIGERYIQYRLTSLGLKKASSELGQADAEWKAVLQNKDGKQQRNNNDNQNTKKRGGGGGGGGGGGDRIPERGGNMRGNMPPPQRRQKNSGKETAHRRRNEKVMKQSKKIEEHHRAHREKQLEQNLAKGVGYSRLMNQDNTRRGLKSTVPGKLANRFETHDSSNPVSNHK